MNTSKWHTIHKLYCRSKQIYALLQKSEEDIVRMGNNEYKVNSTYKIVDEHNDEYVVEKSSLDGTIIVDGFNREWIIIE